MMKIIFATGNQNKVNEVRSILPESIEVVSLKEIGFTQEIEETGTTLIENALLKARTIFEKYKLPVLAEDTGLEVDALNGAPGVYSARYAGRDCNNENNMQLLLSKLKDKSNRKAQFKTIAAYIDAQGKEHLFEGIIKGEIALQKIGKDGFGYDPIFVPNAYTKSFAQMSKEEKSEISHRAIAIQKFVAFVAQN